ncbi:P1 family peptidase [Achromobacter sp. Marseille-Q4962]|uniref:P1 family peptidase n=1 Tax=Achromobacter sp. Marseille-Q4962 TaxID=2942202 RepID=UPI00207390AC|nr:P1 family peptidase [Achromobacter sp. Marseille-Q4962]
MEQQWSRRVFMMAAAGAAALARAAPAGAQAAKPMPGQGSLTRVPGIKVGHYTDTRRPTGCTVILAEGGAVAGVDVRGAAPGTRETDLLRPGNLVEQVHAVLLSGGSAFGLDAAGGVMRYLEQQGIGFDAGVARVPIVPAAVLFDLGVGDASVRPDAEAGYQACKAASAEPVPEGNVGAGAGATVGKLYGAARAMKGGLGSAALMAGGVTVGALVAVNAVGDVVDPQTGRVLAGARTADGRALLDTRAAVLGGELPRAMRPGSATTIGVVATDAVLTKAQAGKVAQLAHDGLARAINPIHTMLDGDTIFALGTGASRKPGNPMLLGVLAAEAMAIAVQRAILSARAIAGYPAAVDFAG